MVYQYHSAIVAKLSQFLTIAFTEKRSVEKANIKDISNLCRRQEFQKNIELRRQFKHDMFAPYQNF